jgi:hypothetical protein
MQHDQKQLHQMTQDYLCYMFTVEEIAVLCNVSRDAVSKIRGASDSPFFMNKSRPEWVLEWMRTHPRFQLTKASSVDVLPDKSCVKLVAAKTPAIKKSKSTKTKSWA